MEEIVPVVRHRVRSAFRSDPIVWIVLNYRKRRRLMELHHAERMAAIERGMDLPPLPIELIDGAARASPHLAAAGPRLVLHRPRAADRHGDDRRDDDLPLFGGLIPLGIGLAYLIYYFAEGRKVEAKLLERDLSERENARPLQGPSGM